MVNGMREIDFKEFMKEQGFKKSSIQKNIGKRWLASL
jgi:hypothetical protein